jgi:hypothetical protein
MHFKIKNKFFITSLYYAGQGVDAIGPNGFGSFISRLPGVVDLSHGSNVLFHIANNERLHAIPARFHRSVQFRRIGLIFGQLMNRPA